jgi:predicted sugar kinase
MFPKQTASAAHSRESVSALHVAFVWSRSRQAPLSSYCHCCYCCHLTLETSFECSPRFSGMGHFTIAAVAIGAAASRTASAAHSRESVSALHVAFVWSRSRQAPLSSYCHCCYCCHLTLETSFACSPRFSGMGHFTIVAVAIGAAASR